MARSKNKKRREGAQIANQIQQAVDSRGPRGNLRKLSDKQVKNRLANKREDTRGDRRQLKKLRNVPQTRNLVPGPNGMVAPPNPNQAAIKDLRQGLSGFRRFRQEAERRKVRPEPAQAQPKGPGHQKLPSPGRPGQGAQKPALPVAVPGVMGAAGGTPPRPGLPPMSQMQRPGPLRKRKPGRVTATPRRLY